MDSMEYFCSKQVYNAPIMLTYQFSNMWMVKLLHASSFLQEFLNVTWGEDVRWNEGKKVLRFPSEIDGDNIKKYIQNGPAENADQQMLVLKHINQGELCHYKCTLTMHPFTFRMMKLCFNLMRCPQLIEKLHRFILVVEEHYGNFSAFPQTFPTNHRSHGFQWYSN